MEYREYPPHPHLTRFIECYWSAFSDKPPFREQESLIPDGTIELMFNFGDSYHEVNSNGKKEIKGSHVIGIRRQSLLISQTSNQHFFCIRFKFGGTYPFFKIPAHLFANGFYTLTELLNNQLQELEERLFYASDNLKRVEIADEYLLSKVEFNNRDFLFAEDCSRYLMQSGNIGTTCHNFNVSYKTLERRFQKVLGVSPTQLMKITRFNNAVLSMYSCNFNSLTAVAYACGYYDQSHFIREFKELTGFTPGDFLREQFTIVQVIQPALAERMSKSYNF